jgi:hypothetical protein
MGSVGRPVEGLGRQDVAGQGLAYAVGRVSFLMGGGTQPPDVIS